MARFAPKDFEPTDKNIKWALETFKISRKELDRQTELMLDHEFRRSYTDFQRVWRNWIRKADEIGTLKREYTHRKPEVVTEDMRQQDMTKFQEQMQSLVKMKAVK